MEKRRKRKKRTNKGPKSFGFGYILLVSIAVVMSSFSPKIESTQAVEPVGTQEANEIQWPQKAPNVELMIHNKTSQRIKATYGGTTIGYINPSRRMATSILEMDAPIDQEGNEWELNELYTFTAPGNRQIVLNPSLFIKDNALQISCAHCKDVNTAHVSEAVNILPEKKYRVVFTIDGKKFENSTAEFREINS